MLAKPGQKILRIPGFHTIPAELIEDEVGNDRRCNCFGLCSTQTRFDHATAARTCGSSAFTSAVMPGMELAVAVHHTQGVFTHLLPGKEFLGSIGEVQAQLRAFAMDLGTQFVVGQQQAALGTGGGTTGIEKPARWWKGLPSIQRDSSRGATAVRPLPFRAAFCRLWKLWVRNGLRLWSILLWISDG
jgi:hypothetical protein